MNTRRCGSAAIWFATVGEEGSTRSSCGPAGATTMCSNVSIFWSALSSNTSKSAAVRSCTGTPLRVAKASTCTKFVPPLNRGGRCGADCCATASSPIAISRDLVTSHLGEWGDGYLMGVLMVLMVLMGATGAGAKGATGAKGALLQRRPSSLARNAVHRHVGVG